MYKKLYSWDHLLAAYRKAAKGKRSSSAVARFERRLEENLTQLQTELKLHSYQPGDYKHFFIHEPKKRLISAAPFRDRVIHHALCSLIEPMFERSFIDDSYANRVGKGTHRALDRAQYFAQRYRYVLHLDIQQFFPNVDHQVLFSLIERKVQDKEVLTLVQQILDSGLSIPRKDSAFAYFAEDDLFDRLRPRGLPIGNLTSQIWANVYMNPIDHFIKRSLRCKPYLRYVDDLLLFAEDKKDLWAWKKAVVTRLSEFRLRIHPTSHPRPVTEGFAYLGFVLYPDRRLLLRRKAVHFRRRLSHLIHQLENDQIEMEKLKTSVGGWINHVRYGNTVGLQKALLKQAANQFKTLDLNAISKPVGS